MAIDRKKIIKAAFSLLDAEGLDGLTMRQLALHLDIQAPSLYWHFKNRSALLDEMADALFLSVARDVDPAAGWQDSVRHVAREVRAAFKSRRDGAKLFAGTYPVSENVMRVADAMISAIKSAGLAPGVAGSAAFSILYYVIGFVIEEQSVDAFDGGGGAAFAALKDQTQRYASGHHATIVEALPAIADEDFDGRFEFGLSLFVRGLRDLLSETPPAES